MNHLANEESEVCEAVQDDDEERPLQHVVGVRTEAQAHIKSNDERLNKDLLELERKDDLMYKIDDQVHGYHAEVAQLIKQEREHMHVLHR